MFDILRRPPVTVGELVAALGLRLHDIGEPWRPDDRSVRLPHGTASYDWDPYHQAPVTTVAQLGRVHLSSYELSFPGGRFRCEQALHDTYGPPREVARRRRYGSFFVDAADRDAFRLEWYRQEPEWAMLQADEAVRWQAVRCLADRIRRAPDEQQAQAAVDGLQLGATPPLRAVDLAVALGYPGYPHAVARSVDVHMSVYVLADLRGDRVERLWVGRYLVEAMIGSPSGGDVEGVQAPAARVCRVGPGDPVTSVRLTRRDERE